MRWISDMMSCHMTVANWLTGVTKFPSSASSIQKKRVSRAMRRLMQRPTAIMNTRTITSQLERLSVSLSKTCVRHGSSKPRYKAYVTPKFEPGHGEKIWIFRHFKTNQVVYSHDPVLKQNRALKQLPFTGKNLRPSSIRKDYWKPIAMIEFPEGLGIVGRSVYQRLREFRMMHELEWGPELLRDKDGKSISKKQRGRLLNDQKANTVADVAAVLGGAGKGNRISSSAPDKDQKEVSQQDVLDEKSGFVKATVWWMDSLDQNYAQTWSSNVTHQNFSQAMLERLERNTVEGASTPSVELQAQADAQNTKEATA